MRPIRLIPPDIFDPDWRLYKLLMGFSAPYEFALSPKGAEEFQTQVPVQGSDNYLYSPHFLQTHHKHISEFYSQEKLNFLKRRNVKLLVCAFAEANVMLTDDETSAQSNKDNIKFYQEFFKGINPKKIIVLTTNDTENAILSKKLLEHGIEYRCESVNFFEREVASYNRHLTTSQPTELGKQRLAMPVKRPDARRLGLIFRLMADNNLQYLDYSLHLAMTPQVQDWGETYLDWTGGWVDFPAESVKPKNTNQRKFEMYYYRYRNLLQNRLLNFEDSDRSDRDINTNRLLMKTCRNTDLMLVCESDSLHRFFPTEKTWRCILLEQPFFVLARKGYWEKMRELGYKSYSPYIDETYDTLNCEFERISALSAEVKRLAEMPEDEYCRLIRALKRVARDNKKIMLERTKDPFILEF